jgi:hypothetical protein
MRLAAYHDSNGNILGLAVSPTDDGVFAEVTSTTPPGLRMTEVKIPSGLNLKFDDPPRLNEELDRLVRDYRVHQGALDRRA